MAIELLGINTNSGQIQRVTSTNPATVGGAGALASSDFSIITAHVLSVILPDGTFNSSSSGFTGRALYQSNQQIIYRAWGRNLDAGPQTVTLQISSSDLVTGSVAAGESWVVESTISADSTNAQNSITKLLANNTQVITASRTTVDTSTSGSYSITIYISGGNGTIGVIADARL